MAVIDVAFLTALTEVPSVGTACGPALRLLAQRFGDGYARTLAPDGFCLFQKAGAGPGSLRVVFVAHLDEIGGCVYGPRPEAEGGGYNARFWGNAPEIFAGATLQAFDYLAEDAGGAFPVRAEVGAVGEERRLALHGAGIRPYRTVWTFRETTTFDGDVIEGKALDPRVTLYAVAEAVRALDTPEVGAVFVMAEECAMDVARKAVTFLQRNAPNLQLIANADVPWIENIGEGRLDLPAIRIFEGRNFIDPSFGIRVAETLQAQGVELHLSAARSGSQTILFTPLAPTLSVALPSDGVHLPRVKMSRKGTERCVALLRAIGEGALHGAFA
jgi:putative aminopeptidase FrvX